MINSEHVVDTIDAHQAVAHGAHGPELLGFSAEGWVYWGVTIFLLLAIFVFKFPKLIAKALDDKIAEARRQLDEAQSIRSEAEALLAEAKRRHQASAGDADAILAHAQDEAKDIVAKAHADAEELTKRRQKMAEDKIAAAERQAIADVRAKAADAAALAAGRVIAAKHDVAADREMVDRTIAGLGRLN
ncbi:hypothetical protein KY084_13295 [Stakelama sp. CBK3Z-3]|uniref:ATP synthase subunit b n=1 Tax=Stakelama flava TaxID=2860338 RepID=A0ABS6XPY4_9SPHN|nr:hypothetical protein [Stakelama flava]MBW4331843.1 hypothetical protein [Stakelama flava]